MGPRVTMIRARAAPAEWKPCPVDDQADTPVQSFVPGVVDAESDRGQDPRTSFADGGGEGDERFQAASLCFGAEPVQQERDVGLVQVGVEHRA